MDIEKQTSLMNISQAATYTGLPQTFFKNLIRHRNGPDFVMPGLRSKFFREKDLDQWMKSWKKSTDQYSYPPSE